MQHYILNTSDLAIGNWTDEYHFSLNTDAVHVYLIEIDTQHKYKDLLTSLLDKVELERLSRFKKTADQLRYIYAHGALRILCGKYLQQPANTILFSETINKKPCIEICFGNLFFNLSHSGNKIVIAFSTQSEVGADIEQIRPDLPIEDFTERNYSENEVNAINNSNTTEKYSLFFKYWSRKEAWLKAVGTGIFNNLKAVDTALEKNQITSEQYIDGHFDDNFYCYSFSIEDYRASIVINKKPDQLSFINFTFDKLLKT